MPPRVLASDQNPAGAKTIIRFGFCDIQNNQGLGKGYSGYHKNIIQSLFIITFLLTAYLW